MDLPQFTTFTTGEDSFTKTTSLTLSSTLTLSFSSDVPFTNGKYSKDSNIFSHTFRYITSDSITSESSTLSSPSSHSLTTSQTSHPHSSRKIILPVILFLFPLFVHLPLLLPITPFTIPDELRMCTFCSPSCLFAPLPTTRNLPLDVNRVHAGAVWNIVKRIENTFSGK